MKKSLSKLSNKIKLIIGSVIVLFLLGWGVYTNHLKNVVKTQENRLEQSISIDLYRHLLDSLKNRDLIIKDSTYRALEKEYEIKLKDIKKQSNNSEKDYYELVEVYFTDTLHRTDNCDSIAKEGIKAVEDKKKEISLLEETISIKDLRLMLNDTIIGRVKKDLANCENNTDILKNQLAKKENWWNRNKFEIGIGTGVVATTTLVYFISKFAK